MQCGTLREDRGAPRYGSALQTPGLRQPVLSCFTMQVIMNVKILSSSIVVCLGLSGAFAADQSSSTVPSKQEERKIESVVGEEVGRSAFDGITVSGGKAFVTRDSKTEELVEQLTLDDGTRVQPDGTIKTSAGRDITLKPNEVLRFNGKIAIVRESAPAVTATPQLSSSSSESNVAGVVVGAPPRTAGTVSASDSAGFVSIPSVVAPGATTIGTTALAATEVTTDPATGLQVFSAVNPATGVVVRTTTDPRTKQSISTTTLNGRQVSTTTNPQTGLPVTITTDSSGRSTATTIDPTTGQSVPAQFNPQTGQVTTTTGTGSQPAGTSTQPGTSTQQISPLSNQTQQGQNQQPLQQQGSQATTTQQPSSTATGTGTTPTGTSGGSGLRSSPAGGGTGSGSGTRSGTSGSTSGGASGGTSGGASGGGR
jgi:hypothetical protein